MLLLFWATQGGEVVVPPEPQPQQPRTGGGGGGGKIRLRDHVERSELEDIYDRILGIEKPAPVVAKAIKAVERVSDEIRPEPVAVDWDAVAADVRAVKALLAAYEAQLIEDDDEDAITALFLLLEAV